MARTGKLSAVEVAKAKGPVVPHDGRGLYLRVAPTGTKSWVFRFQIDGKRRDMGLGAFPDISLAEARAKAAEHRRQRHEGVDPLEARAAERRVKRLSAAKERTFRDVAEEFIARNEAGWRNPKHRQQWRNTLATYVYPTTASSSGTATCDSGTRCSRPAFIRLAGTANQSPPDKGGYNVFCTLVDRSLPNIHPYGHLGIRADGKEPINGWANSPKIEELRAAWLETADLAEQQRVCR